MNKAVITYMNGDVMQVEYDNVVVTEGACFFMTQNELGDVLESMIVPLCNVKDIQIDLGVVNEPTP